MAESTRGTSASMPERIGSYRILEFLGAGGMGEVYLARHEQLEKRVALKVIKLGMDTKEVLARFEQERNALARMDHHNIARVLDAGVTETGRPFFVMEYVPGVSLTHYCRERRLSVRDRVKLLLQVCDAVQHAHQKAVIHRDLTPRNILVREENDKPVVKVIDFGLARAVDHLGAALTLFTEQGQMLGTIEYMSPEQAAGKRDDIDVRSDIYSLGVILYELLVGELPIGRMELRRAGILEAQRMIQEVDPKLPSLHLRTVSPDSEELARERGTTTAGLRRIVSEDLDWITMKALEKDRRRRYPAVQSLADNLVRYLRNEPVDLGPPSPTYRLRKWMARHRVGVMVGGATVLSLVVGLVVSLLLLAETRTAQAETERARRSEQLVADDGLAVLLDGEMDELWPAHPRRLAVFDEWLFRARDLLGRQAAQQDRQQDLRQRLAVTTDPGERDRLARILARAEATGRALDRLAGEGGAVATVSARRREAVAAWQPEAGEVLRRWQRVHRELGGDPAFARVEVPMIPWLLPIGRGPGGLQEFLVVGTGLEPARSAEGAIVPAVEDGIVLVFVPPGECRIGAQSRDPALPGYFRIDLPEVDGLGAAVIGAEASEAGDDGQVVPVVLAAFWIAKYEITQAQWQRLAGDRPSQWGSADPGQQAADDIDPGEVPLRPVENVSFDRAVRVLARVGLVLPTEGQWEYACRAGSSAMWPWGDGVEDLPRRANFADVSARQKGLTAASCRLAERLGLDDGFLRTTPAGHYQGNRFCLFDMLGNVAEWCLGGYTDDYAAGIRPGDGLVLRTDGRGPDQTVLQAVRGFSWGHGLDRIRPSARIAYDRRNTSQVIGVRAALRLPPR